jgi:cytochrome P450
LIAATKPRGPKNPPLIGNLPVFRRNPVKFLSRMASTYGDMAYFRLGPVHAYFFNHPEFVRDILVTRQGNFIKSRMLQRARVLLGEGLLTSEGQFHLRQRRMVQPAFHRGRLAGYAAVMGEYAARTGSRWQAGQTLDVADEMMRLTLAVVGKTLFSADVETEATEIGSALTSVLKMFDMLMLPFSEYFEKLPIPAVKRFERGRDTLDRIIYKIIAERRASREDQGDLLSMLLLAQDEEASAETSEAERRMSDKQIRDEALTLFLAGHETTANALTWTWYLLSQNPECESRMHEEVDRVLSGRTPGFDDFPALRYTEMVLAEAMRLYPPAWGVGRMNLEAFEIGGIEVPARSICLLSPYVMHRNPAYYPDPERFDPERWTPEARQARPKFSYFPFGGGSRVCIGERFAWLEGVLILAALARKWKLRLEPGHPVEILPLITLRTKHGMKMTVHPR